MLRWLLPGNNSSWVLAARSSATGYRLLAPLPGRAARRLPNGVPWRKTAVVAIGVNVHVYVCVMYKVCIHSRQLLVLRPFVSRPSCRRPPTASPKSRGRQRRQSRHEPRGGRKPAGIVALLAALLHPPARPPPQPSQSAHLHSPSLLHHRSSIQALELLQRRRVSTSHSGTRGKPTKLRFPVAPAHL